MLPALLGTNLFLVFHFHTPYFLLARITNFRSLYFTNGEASQLERFSERDKRLLLSRPLAANIWRLPVIRTELLAVISYLDVYFSATFELITKRGQLSLEFARKP